MNNERLGEILFKEGLIGSQELEFCLSVQKNNGRQKLGELICHYDFVEERSIAKAIAYQVGWKFFEGEYLVDENMLSFFGINFFIERMVFPVCLAGQSIFVFSKTDDTNTTDEINCRLNIFAPFYIGVESALRNALEQLVQRQKTEQMDLKQDFLQEEGLNQWFENVLMYAVTQLASDIHIEPSQKVIEIRLRIDGILHFYQALPLKYLSRLVNIIFHKSDLAISDFSHFHDAKFLYQYFQRQVDVRVSHVPSVNGSSIVLRLLDKGKAAITLSNLGYELRSWTLIKENLKKPQGITLIVGPTGCGKTTTLYAILNHLKSIDSKILTIEDPIEIQLPLMTQIQINEKRKITFGSSVRAFLRHDPDIILIGEIRDELTAQEALRAAMTGHQVFTTLHTNRAFDAILRLHDLGLPFTHMADHISMIISQRLVRKLCPSCKRSKILSRNDVFSEQRKYFQESEQKVYIAHGCNLCRQGYLGQNVVAEVLPINEMMGEFIMHGDLIGIKKYIKDGHCPTMIQDATRLVANGITSLEEVSRILG